MEFENVGAHCQQEGCNQKDFLPFRCATCSRSLCLSHRSYVSHNCNGDKMKDMTSIDCPICGKSVKFDKTQDVNTVWNEHYLTMCTQTAPATHKIITKCFKPGCNKTLGPSNTFECPKCHQKVCLSHRIPEEHSCVGYIRKEFLERVQKDMAVGNNKHPGATTKAEKSTTQKYSHGFFMPTKNRLSSPHKSHAEETKKTPHESSPPTPPAPHPSHASHSAPSLAHATIASAECPFCATPQISEAKLMNHILAFHPDDSGGGDSGGGGFSHMMPPPPPGGRAAHHTAASPLSSMHLPPPPSSTQAAGSSSSASSAGSSVLHREVCPLCHARFADPIALVRHFESSHSERSRQLDQQLDQQQQQQSGTGTNCSVS